MSSDLLVGAKVKFAAEEVFAKIPEEVKVTDKVGSTLKDFSNGIEYAHAHIMNRSDRGAEPVLYVFQKRNDVIFLFRRQLDVAQNNFGD